MAVVTVLLPCFSWGASSTTESLKEVNRLSSRARQERLVTGAKSEGRVVVYGSASVADVNPTFLDFRARYPFIQVDYVRTRELTEKALMEKRAGRILVDILIGGADRSYLGLKEKMLASYHSPEREAIIPSFKDKEGYWVGLDFTPVVIAYHAGFVRAADAPKSYADLLHPRWRGKVSLDADPRYLVAALYLEWGEERAVEFLKKLVENDVQVRRGRTLQTQLLCAGEFSLSTDLFAHGVVPMVRKGCPVKMALPKPTPVHITSITMAEGAPHPHAAALFYDYLLTKAGMEKYAQQGRIPTRKDVVSPFPELAGFMENPDMRVLRPEEIGPIHEWVRKTIDAIIQRRTR